MNAEPKNEQAQKRPGFREALKQTPGRLAKICIHNWGWKLLSVVLAITLWAALISQDPTLTREITFSDVPVTVSGADTLKRSGLVVLSGLDGDALSIRLRADVPQRTYSTALASNYSPRVDLSRITETGEQTLRILTTSSTAYGTVDAVIPDSLTVMVDEYVTNYRVPVSVNLIGSYPAGYYGSTPVLDPGSVSVSGPKSIVDNVTNIYLDFDVSKLAAHEGLVRTALPMRVTDADGNAVNAELLEVTSANVVLRTITVEQRLYATKTLSVAGMALTTGTPAEGYELKSVVAVPATLLAAGEQGSLEALDTLFVDSPVDITGRSESFTVDVALRRPSDLYYLSDSTVTLYLELAPIMTTATYDGLKLETRGQADGVNVTLSDSKVKVAVTGPQNLLAGLKSSQISAYVDVSAVKPGDNVLPVLVEVDSGSASSISYSITPATVTAVVPAE